MRVSRLDFATVSEPTTAMAVDGTLSEEPELPPHALTSSAVEQIVRPTSGTRRRTGRCMGQPCEKSLGLREREGLRTPSFG